MSSSRRRRDLEIFSLSFLDCICCGFGAIVLLFVLSKMEKAPDPPPPPVLEPEPVIVEDLSGVVKKLEEQLHEVRGDVTVLNRELLGRREQLSETKTKVARLQGEMSELQGQYAASKQNSSIQNNIEGRLARAQQELSEEMKRLQAQQRAIPRRAPDAPVGGIPVDSEYIIFIIDTSGSMQNHAWPLAMRKMRETLDIYPKVKGIQVMNDMGQYMFSQYRGKWIPDTPGRRKAIIDRMRAWKPFSNSSPVEGIRAAIRTFYSPDKKISLYVLGDEFMGGSAQAVINEVDNINKADARGNRMVRIHGIGFPVMFHHQGPNSFSGVQFAMLMRALCERNGGTFVGLNSLK